LTRKGTGDGAQSTKDPKDNPYASFDPLSEKKKEGIKDDTWITKKEKSLREREGDGSERRKRVRTSNTSNEKNRKEAAGSRAS